MTDDSAPTIASGGDVVRRMFCALLATIALIQGKADAMAVNGTEMTMDQAIMAAAQSPSVFRLMQDANVVRVEMDMLFKSEVWESMMRERENSTRRHRRKVIRDQRLRWPGATIPYQIAVSWTDREYQQFQQALGDYHGYTCVRFRQATSTDSDYLRIVDGGGCSSYVGRQGGPQTVSLASGCRLKGIIIHELGHAVGFHHEQTRPDRDGYVNIAHENIDSNMLFNFQKYTAAEVETVSVPYDYLSVMHYGQYAFSRNGQRTIRTVDPAYQSRIGNRGGFSFRDIKLVNAIYGCAARNKCPERQCPGEGFVGPDCVCWCPSGDETRPVMPCSGQTSTTFGPATMSPCADGRSECAPWARFGHCSNAQYREFMSVNCKASCNLCSGRPTVAVTTTARPSTAAPCADDNYACPQWAQLGYCSSGQYRLYMSIHCNASCNVCSVTPTKVTLHGSQAPVTHLQTVVRQTQLSTVRHQQTTSTRPATSSRPVTIAGNTTPRWRPCQDANDMCRAWAHRGECDANPQYMLVHCTASCHSCDSAAVATACRDLEVHCDYWRGRGHCSSQLYAPYMQQHCPRACGVCPHSASTAASASPRSPPRVAAAATAAAPRVTTKMAAMDGQRGNTVAATTRGAGRNIVAGVNEHRRAKISAYGEAYAEREQLSEQLVGASGGVSAGAVSGGPHGRQPKDQAAVPASRQPQQQRQPRLDG